MTTKTQLIEHVKKCRKNAELSQSALPKEVLELQGMSGQMTRHFYNNLCSLPHARYLEVGSWQGSTLISAMYGNDQAAAVAIDNWSEFGGPRKQFDANVATHLPNSWVKVVESDCFKANLGDRKFNIYLYDGGHEYHEQRQAITYFYKYLEMPCILIVDDWNWVKVRQGTFDGLKEMNANIVYEDHVQHTQDDSHSPMDVAVAQYWNGMGLFVLDTPRLL